MSDRECPLCGSPVEYRSSARTTGRPKILKRAHARTVAYVVVDNDNLDTLLGTKSDDKEQEP